MREQHYKSIESINYREDVHFELVRGLVDVVLRFLCDEAEEE